MTSFALILVLSAAVVHATWNLLAKRAGDAGLPFVWLFASISVAIYAPIAAVVVLVQRPGLGYVSLLFMAGSGAIHAGYYLLLQRGYATGDLSVVYPLARGTGPLLATAAAVFVFDERLGLPAALGLLLIVAGVFVLSGGGTGLGRGALYGVMTGAFIAAYTLWDKGAVSVILVPPLLLDWGSNIVRAALLSPFAARRREEVRSVWREYRREVLGVAVLSPLAYILVLTALVSSPVGYVAPVREVSVLFGVLMGAHFLSEEGLARRLLAATAMVVGVVILTVG